MFWTIEIICGASTKPLIIKKTSTEIDEIISKFRLYPLACIMKCDIATENAAKNLRKSIVEYLFVSTIFL